MSETLFGTECIRNEKCESHKFWIDASVLLLFTLLFFVYENEIIAFLKNGLSFWRLQTFKSLRRSEAHNTYSRFAPDVENESMGTGFIKIIFYYYKVIHILKSNGDKGDKQNLFGSLQDVFIKVFNLVIANLFL